MLGLKAILIGLVFGVLCAALKLPIPAPPTLAGVLGIIGVFAGYWLVTQVFWLR